MMIKQK